MFPHPDKLTCAGREIGTPRPKILSPHSQTGQHSSRLKPSAVRFTMTDCTQTIVFEAMLIFSGTAYGCTAFFQGDPDLYQTAIDLIIRESKEVGGNGGPLVGPLTLRFVTPGSRCLCRDGGQNFWMWLYILQLLDFASKLPFPPTPRFKKYETAPWNRSPVREWFK